MQLKSGEHKLWYRLLSCCTALFIAVSAVMFIVTPSAAVESTPASTPSPKASPSGKANTSPAKASPTPRNERSTLPINVKSNELFADNKNRTALFTGKVVAKQGDITIFSDRLTVYYGENQSEVEKIVAEGSVRIIQENRTGTSAHALYESKEGRITLTGNTPKVTQGKDSVTGKVIVYYLDEDRSVVTSGGDTRVEAIIQPPPKKSNVEPR